MVIYCVAGSETETKLFIKELLLRKKTGIMVPGIVYISLLFSVTMPDKGKV